MNPADQAELAEARRARVKAMTVEGMSASQIAAALRISDRTVVRDRRFCGVSLGDPTVSLTDGELEVASRLIADGCSYMEVARTIGRSRTTVAKCFPGHSWSRQMCGEFRAAQRYADERLRAVLV